ncbi:tetratricopeptide repeat protein [Glaciecola sp. 2405UD65-10]|uniref:tetratricopeptide repeat protein n=1 Tax=Glaciecola sp. 2405UD65-10 TaxID=3397244 RepID=UPI003B5AD308
MKYLKRIIISSSLLLIISCSKPLTEEQTLTNSQELVENNKSSTAIIVLKKYLSENTGADAIRAKLAEVLAISGDYYGAIDQFNKVKSSLNPNAFERKVEALYMTTDMSLALETTKLNKANNQAGLQNSDVVEALLLSRLEQDKSGFARLKNSEQSLIGKLANAVATFSENSNTIEFYNQLNSINEEFASAQQNYLFLHLFGNFAFVNSEYEKSANAYKALEVLRPAFAKIKVLAAESLVRGKNWPEAAQYVDEILKQSPNQPVANQLKALISVKDNDLETAKIHIERALSGGYETHKNYLLAADLNFTLGNYEQTINFLEKGLRGLKVRTNYHNMLTYAKAKLGGDDNVLDTFKKNSISNLSDLQNVVAYIEGLESVGDNQALENVRDVISISPDADVATQLEFAIFNMVNGKQASYEKSVAASKELIADAYKNPNNYSQKQVLVAKNIIVGDLVKNQQFKEAENTINDWIEAEPFNSSNAMYLADVYNLSKQFEKTKSILKPTEIEFDNSHMYILLSNAYANTQDYTGALDTAKTGIAKFPYSITLLRQTAALSLNLNTDVSEYVESIYEQSATRVEDSILLSLYYAMVKQKSKAVSVLESFTFEEQKSVTYWYTLAESYIAVGENEKALSAISNTLNTYVLSIEQINSILSVLGKVDGVKQSILLLEEQLVNYPNNVRFKLQLSDLYLSQGNVEQAQDTVDSLSAINPDVMVKKADIALRSGNLMTATKLYKEAFNQFPTERTLIPYAQHLHAAGQTAQAMDELTAFSQSNSRAVNALLLMATMQTGSDAMANYRKVLAINPNNLVALNNLALALNEDKQFDEAKSLADRAIALAPDNTEIQNTVALVNANL